MFKRRNGVIAFLVVAVMLLGVGFAALTDTLTINGTGNAQQTALETTFDSYVGFSDYAAGTCTVAAVADKTNVDYATLPDVVTFEATGFTKIDDQVVAIYTVKNTHPDLGANIPATLTATVADKTANTGHSNYFSATAVPNVTYLAPNGGEATVTVTLTMIHTPIDTSDVTVSVEFEAEAVDLIA